MRIITLISLVSVVTASFLGKRHGREEDEEVRSMDVDSDNSTDSDVMDTEDGHAGKRARAESGPRPTPFTVMLEELVANPDATDQAIIHRINSEIPNISVGPEFVAPQRAFINRISHVPVWLHTYLLMNVQSFDIGTCREVVSHLMRSLRISPDQFGSPEEMAQAIHIWGQYCIIPLRSGFVGTCHAGQAMHADGSVHNAWVMSPAAIQQFMLNTLNAQYQTTAA